MAIILCICLYGTSRTSGQDLFFLRWKLRSYKMKHGCIIGMLNMTYEAVCHTHASIHNNSNPRVVQPKNQTLTSLLTFMCNNNNIIKRDICNIYFVRRASGHFFMPTNIFVLHFFAFYSPQQLWNTLYNDIIYIIFLSRLYIYICIQYTIYTAAISSRKPWEKRTSVATMVIIV